MYHLCTRTLFGFLLVAAPTWAGDDIKVCVVAILVSDKNNVVDERLVDFAKEVQKLKPHLTGFKVGNSSSESIPMGETKVFRLVDKQTIEVTVNSTVDENGRIVLTIKPPNLNQITYTCTCNRYFSMATQYYTKDKEQLFIAVMGKPCNLAAPPPAKKP
jgi:hypothetical protein